MPPMYTTPTLRRRPRLPHSGQMVAALLAGPGQVEYCDVPLPVPSPSQVLVKIEGCGICPTHVPFWQGRVHYASEPGAPGRDAWGHIVAKGGEVRHLDEGDRVAILSSHAYAQYDVVEAHLAVRLPASLDTDPFPGRSLSTAINIFRRAGINPGDRVAILGVGFIATVLTQLCNLAQAETVVMSQRRCTLRFARQLGADHILPLENIDDKSLILQALHESVGHSLFDIVIETTGTQVALDVASELTRERGRLVVAGRRHDGSRTVDMRLWNWRGLDVINAHDRSSSLCMEGLREAVAAVNANLITPAPLYTHRYPFDRLSDALTLASERPEGFIKAIVDM